jgi:hypothetical protein
MLAVCVVCAVFRCVRCVMFGLEVKLIVGKSRIQVVATIWYGMRLGMHAQ